MSLAGEQNYTIACNFAQNLTKKARQRGKKLAGEQFTSKFEQNCSPA